MTLKFLKKILLLTFSFSLSFSNVFADFKDVKVIYESLDLSLPSGEVEAFVKHLAQYPYEEVQTALLERFSIEIRIGSAGGPNFKMMKTILQSMQEVGSYKNIKPLSILFITARNFWIKNKQWMNFDMDETFKETLSALKKSRKKRPLLSDAPEDAIHYEKFLEDQIGDFDKHYPKPTIEQFEKETKTSLTKKIIGQPEVVDKITEIMLQDFVLEKRERPELIYLMGPPGTGKDTSAEAMVDVIHNAPLAHQEHLFSIEPLVNNSELWKILGSATGYIGSDEFPPFLEFLVNHSGGRYLLSKSGNGFKVVENSMWKGVPLPGYNSPSSAVVFLNEFHDWSKNAKNVLVKRFLERGTVPINNPKGGLKEIDVPVTIVIASNEGLGLVTSREINGQRFGRPLSYEDSLKLWSNNHNDSVKLKDELSKTGGGFGVSGMDSKGTSEEIINRIPEDRLLLLRPLSPQDIQKIAVIKLEQFRNKVRNSLGEYKNIKLLWDQSLLKFIQEYKYVAEDNARPMETRIKGLIQQTFFQACIDGKIPANLNVFVKLSARKRSNGSWNINFHLFDEKALNRLSTITKFSEPVKETLKDVIPAPISDKRIDELLQTSSRMKEQVFGNEDLIDKVSKSILLSEEGRMAIRTIDDAKLPARSFMFLGPSSVGKTELAKVIAEEILGHRNELVVMDFSQVTSIEDIKHKILGKKDGLGNPIPSQFMKEFDRRSGKLVVVFDEIANAHPSHLKALYDILREPLISTFSDGKERIMSGVTLILTGNAGEEWYQGIPIDHTTENMQRAARDEIYKRMTADGRKTRATLQKYFSDAFINRIGEQNIFFFPSLSHKATMELFNLKMKQAVEDLASKKSQRGWKVSFGTPEEYRQLAEILEEEAFILEEQGASIDRFVKQEFADQLRFKLLEDRVPNNTEVVISVEKKDVQKNKINLKISLSNRETPLTLEIRRKKRIEIPEGSKREQIFTAYHEAGHSLVRQVFFEDIHTPERISIIPGVTQINGDWIVYSGVAESLQKKETGYTRSRMLREIAILSAGHMAERLISIGERAEAGMSNDMYRATQNIARRAILELGLSDKWGGHVIPPHSDINELTEKQKQLLWEEIDKMLKECEDLARKALSANFDSLAELAVLLAEKGEMKRKDLHKFYKKHELLNESNWDQALKKWEKNYKKETYKAVIPRDREIRKGIPLPKKIADIEEILKARKQKQLEMVTNYHESCNQLVSLLMNKN